MHGLRESLEVCRKGHAALRRAAASLRACPSCASAGANVRNGRRAASDCYIVDGEHGSSPWRNGVGLGTVIPNVQIVFVAIVAWVWHGERPRARTIAMIGVVLFGTVGKCTNVLRTEWEGLSRADRV